MTNKLHCNQPEPSKSDHPSTKALRRPLVDEELKMRIRNLGRNDKWNDVVAEAKIHGAEKVVSVLIHLPGEENWAVVWNATDAYVKIGMPALNGLVKALKDKNWKTRLWAASALGSIAEKVPDFDCSIAVPALIELLMDKNPNFSDEAVEALGKIASVYPALVETVVPCLIETLMDEDERVRRKAFGAIIRISENGTHGTTETIVRAIQHMLNSSEFLREAERNSTKYVQTIELLVEIIDRLQMKEAA